MSDVPAVPLDTLLAPRAWIRALARSLVRDPADVDDIEQEVYVAAMKGPHVRGAGVEPILRRGRFHRRRRAGDVPRGRANCSHRAR